MTSPDGVQPSGSIGYGELAAYAAKSEQDWRAEMAAPHEQAWGDTGFLGSLFQDLARGKPFAVAVLENLIESIWSGTGGLGDVIGGIFDPNAARLAMEETQRRIAAAVAQIIGMSTVSVNFGELPSGPYLPGWDRVRVAGSTGTLVVQDGVLRIVDNVGFGGSRWRALYLDQVAPGADVRVDAVFASAPGFLSGAANKIIAKARDSNEFCFATLLHDRADLGLMIDGRETVLKSSLCKFSPTVPFSVVAQGNTLKLLRDGQLVGEPAVDSRVGAMGGRMVGAEFFTPLTIDPSGGLAAIGFRAPASLF